MEEKNHRLLVISYELYAVENGQEIFIEKTEEATPMTFYTGCDMVVKAFEEEVIKIEDNIDFELFLSKEQAYGAYEEESVKAFDRAMFEQDGQLDTQNVFVDAVIPLENEDGQRFLGKVKKITEKEITIDLNHPLAGKDLKFRGHMILNREASQEEVDNLFAQMNNRSCGCGNCGGGCSSEEGGSCGCGHNDCDCDNDSCVCGCSYN